MLGCDVAELELFQALPCPLTCGRWHEPNVAVWCVLVGRTWRCSSRQAVVAKSLGTRTRRTSTSRWTHPSSVSSGVSRTCSARSNGCALVGQITRNTEPHGFDSCQGHITKPRRLTTVVRSPWSLTSRAFEHGLSHESLRSRTAHFSQVITPSAQLSGKTIKTSPWRTSSVAMRISLRRRSVRKERVGAFLSKSLCCTRHVAT